MLFLLLSCSTPEQPTTFSCILDGTSTVELWEGAYDTPKLLFQSGFEPDVEIARGEPEADDIVGNDRSVSSLGDWEQDLEAPPLGTFQIFYADGNSNQRSTALIEDPENPQNQVIEFRLHKANEIHVTSADKGRIQFGFNNSTELYALSYSTQMRLEEGFGLLSEHEDKITWMTVAEFCEELDTGE